MSTTDPYAMALRLRVVALIKLYARRRLMEDAYAYWRRWIAAN